MHSVILPRLSLLLWQLRYVTRKVGLKQSLTITRTAIDSIASQPGASRHSQLSKRSGCPQKIASSTACVQLSSQVMHEPILHAGNAALLSHCRACSVQLPSSWAKDSLGQAQLGLLIACSTWRAQHVSKEWKHAELAQALCHDLAGPHSAQHKTASDDCEWPACHSFRDAQSAFGNTDETI